ncbi:helix-turn-helix domain-containing protein [Kitasatospora sp. NPDC005856]|uniref:helix-turn-helix domain-containing protein n=1 Tax=Kitasatospora sp. NPDC005856 TaxID=3154566 RepID=UPI0033F3949B
MDFEIRDRSVNRGCRALTEERRADAQLMQQGTGNEEACRIVGINDRTGRRWGHGRAPSGTDAGGAPPITAPAPGPPSGPARHLHEDERIHIADRLREKATVRGITAEPGRSPSTISREIRRNRHPGNGPYRPHTVRARADACRPRPKPGTIGLCPELRDFVQDRLDRRWSPEQFCHALRDSFPERPQTHVVHETVPEALYLQGRGELRREPVGALRTGPARRVSHRRAAARRPGFAHPTARAATPP